jgi:hypothetical protein
MATDRQESTPGNPNMGDLHFTENMPIQAYTQLLDKMVSSATSAEDFYKIGIYDNTFIGLHVENPEEAFKKVGTDMLNPDNFANYEPVPARSFVHEDESRQVFNWNSQYVQLQLLRNVEENPDGQLRDALMFVSSHSSRLPAGFTKRRDEQNYHEYQLAKQKEHATVVNNFLRYCQKNDLRGDLHLRFQGAGRDSKLQF